MKNFKITVIVSMLLLAVSMMAQAPQKMSYQSVVRNASGNLVTGVTVGVRISILQGSASGTPVYVETHNAWANSNGLVSIEIGAGSIVSGNFSDIDWGNGTYFVKTETDPGGGSNYTISGTSQLLSVPYALYAGNVRGLGRTTIYLTGDISNEEAAQKIANESGTNTENIYIVNTTALTTVNIDAVTDLRNIVIQMNSALQTVTINGAKTTYESFRVIENPNLSNVTLNNYISASGAIEIKQSPNLTLSMPGMAKMDCSYILLQTLQNIDFPSLISINTQAVNNANYYYFSAVNSINLASLVTITGKGIRLRAPIIDLHSLVSASLVDLENATALNMNAITTGNISVSQTTLTNLTFPNFSSGSLSAVSNNALTQISLPNLSHFNAPDPGITIKNNAHLTQISFPMLASMSNYTNFDLQRNALTSTVVNQFLHQLLSVTTPTGSKSATLQFQIPPAPPTGQGIIDKQTLMGQGCWIITD